MKRQLAIQPGQANQPNMPMRPAGQPSKFDSNKIFFSSISKIIC